MIKYGRPKFARTYVHYFRIQSLNNRLVKLLKAEKNVAQTSQV